MTKCTVFRLANADFSNQGLPSLDLFVEKSNLKFAYSFQNGNLNDVSGKVGAAVPVSSGGVTNDTSIISTVLNNSAIRIAGGSLDIPFNAYPLDGSKPATFLVVGGWDGTGNAGEVGDLLDFGNGTSSLAAPMLQFDKTLKTLGMRINNGGSQANVGETIANLANRLFFFAVRFDGTNWNYKNLTTGTVVTKTNAELGISGATVVNTDQPKVKIGHTATYSPKSSVPVIVAQVAMWDKYLTDAQLEQQYINSNLAVNV